MFDLRYKIFHELMPIKIREIVLISTPYEAWIMEEDCRLSERIVHEYKGLNLSHPPRLTWVSSIEEAYKVLKHRKIDLLILMLKKADRAAFSIREEIRKRHPSLMVALLTHEPPTEKEKIEKWRTGDRNDAVFVWKGNTDLLLAMIKGAEDFMNLDHDTSIAGIRIIILVEDSPRYLSAILPILYKLLLVQTQRVMEEGLNDEHRLLAMRARPKIIFVESYEEAWDFFIDYEDYVLCVISDARIPMKNVLYASGGIKLLERVKDKRFDIPCLLYSAESLNAEQAEKINAGFVDKNSPSLLDEVQSFFKEKLGFNDFIFRNEGGDEIARASNLRTLEKQLEVIPDKVFKRHCQQNDFSRWLFVRSEIEIASKVRSLCCEDFSCDLEHRKYLISTLNERRMHRQQGVIVNFNQNSFDTDTNFLKIGNGSLGGKARGLAFMAGQILQYGSQLNSFENAKIVIPQTLVVTTDIFDEFIEKNNLRRLARENRSDQYIAEKFVNADFPPNIIELLRSYLTIMTYPLAVRSSSLLEDDQLWAYAGLYRTYMLPNHQIDLEWRMNHLVRAIKLVYASTYFKGPKTYSKRTGQLVEEEKMAVIIQRVVGVRQDRYFYPAISGMAQSKNYYSLSDTDREDGVATIALGLGKTVMEGERALRFTPEHPEKISQHSSVEEILKNSQRTFYALFIGEAECTQDIIEDGNIIQRNIADAEDEPIVRELTSSYIPEEERIRDSYSPDGYGVLTFSKILKYERFPLAAILRLILKIGKKAFKCPVEIEFCVDQFGIKGKTPVFSILQIRPMSGKEQEGEITISAKEIKKAVCVSTQVLGNTIDSSLKDIVYVDMKEFNPAKTIEIASEIRKINAKLCKEGKKYLLIGPGRWGSADPWLGIPVKWADICCVSGIIETAHEKLKVEPSQGSHFLSNIASLGICYFTLYKKERNYLDWNWLIRQTKVWQQRYVIHSRLTHPYTLKVSGDKSLGILLSPDC